MNTWESNKRALSLQEIYYGEGLWGHINSLWREAFSSAAQDTLITWTDVD